MINNYWLRVAIVGLLLFLSLPISVDATGKCVESNGVDCDKVNR